MNSRLHSNSLNNMSKGGHIRTTFIRSIIGRIQTNDRNPSTQRKKWRIIIRNSSSCAEKDCAWNISLLFKALLAFVLFLKLRDYAFPTFSYVRRILTKQKKKNSKKKAPPPRPLLLCHVVSLNKTWRHLRNRADTGQVSIQGTKCF